MNDRMRPTSPTSPAPRPRPLSRTEFARRVLIVLGLTALVVAIGTVFVLASDVFFLFFAAILLAILLRAAGDAVGRYTFIGAGWGLAVVVVVLLGLAGAGAYFGGSAIVRQFDQLQDDLPNSVAQARARIQQTELGREVLDRAPTLDSLLTGKGGSAAARVTAFFSTTLGVLGNLLVLTFLTLYLAISPRQYVTGALDLVPPGRRQRADRILNAVGFHLKWWLIGRAVAMLAVALIVGVGLGILGVPGYLMLAVLAGLLTAIPFLGPIAGAIPGALVALSAGPTTALWAVGVYLLAQAVENYLLTPLIQERFVRMPPAMTIAAITLIGAVFGFFGLILATPLAVVVLVAVKTLYLEDTLGEDRNVGGEQRSARQVVASH